MATSIQQSVVGRNTDALGNGGGGPASMRHKRLTPIILAGSPSEPHNLGLEKVGTGNRESGWTDMEETLRPASTHLWKYLDPA